MIRSTVRKHRVGAAVLATLGSIGLVILACETPTPPVAVESEPEVAVELTTAVTAPALDAAALDEAIPLETAGVSYFLVEKKEDGVKVLGPVEASGLENVGEDGPATFYLVRESDQLETPVEVEEGSPTFRVRGSGDAPDPLVVVDGVIVSDPDFLSSMDPDLVESVEVIKGAAAEDLYGERGANGVIHITTKKG